MGAIEPRSGDSEDGDLCREEDGMLRTSSKLVLRQRDPLRGRTRFTLGLVALLARLPAITAITVLLAGCGTPIVITAALPTKAPASVDAGPGHLKDCGFINRGLGGTTPANPLDLSQCLLDAFKGCRLAKLKYDESGTDWKDEHIIGITPGVIPGAGACQITDDSTFFLYSTSAGGQQPPVHYTCDGIVLQDGHIVVRDCGAEGNVILP